MGTFAIRARNAAKSLPWEFSRSGKLRKYGGRTFCCKLNIFFGGALSIVSRCICGRPKKAKLTAMLQTKRPRSTLRSSCTSRFTRRFPPRWLKSRWNHSSCSDNSHTHKHAHSFYQWETVTTCTNTGLHRCRHTHKLLDTKIPSEMEVAPRYNCWNCLEQNVWVDGWTGYPLDCYDY